MAADVGITSVDFAIAETGTLVVCSKMGQERLASLAPPVQIAIVERSQIVPDLMDVFDGFGADAVNLPSNLVLITGPSKTGDIELQLTTGVHGPGHVHVLVADW
jgi:L-lactate utilization protein LutC